MKGIDLKGLDMKKFVGTGYHPESHITNTNGRDDGKTNEESKGLKGQTQQVVTEPKERPEVYY